MLQGFALVAYFTRVIGYTLIPNSAPWLVLLLEPLHGCTYAFSKTSAVSFISEHSPGGFESTGQGLMTALRAGAGNLLGMVVSGLIAAKFGQVVLYRAAGGAAFAIFLLFVVFKKLEGGTSRPRRI